MAERKFYTKEHIKGIIKLWENNSVDEIANKLGITPQAVVYLAKQIREEGYNLPKKHIVGKTRSLIKSVLSEL